MRHKQYMLIGHIIKMQDGYIVLQDNKSGSKFKIAHRDCQYELLQGKLESGALCSLLCRGAPDSRQVDRVCKTIYALNSRKQKTRRIEAFKDNDSLHRDRHVVKGKSNYNGSMPAVRNRKNAHDSDRVRYGKYGNEYINIDGMRYDAVRPTSHDTQQYRDDEYEAQRKAIEKRKLEMEAAQ